MDTHRNQITCPSSQNVAELGFESRWCGFKIQSEPHLQSPTILTGYVLVTGIFPGPSIRWGAWQVWGKEMDERIFHLSCLLGTYSCSRTLWWKIRVGSCLSGVQQLHWKAGGWEAVKRIREGSGGLLSTRKWHRWQTSPEGGRGGIIHVKGHPVQ